MDRVEVLVVVRAEIERRQRARGRAHGDAIGEEHHAQLLVPRRRDKSLVIRDPVPPPVVDQEARCRTPSPVASGEAAGTALPRRRPEQPCPTSASLRYLTLWVN
ncbi:hypothetical protein HET64_06320 [Streptomyces sp. McG3]|nr:hypothetical protein [Streptomyces sp. McG3]MBT2896274.1 hypothetical protein [Streptomyces sp. McG3]